MSGRDDAEERRRFTTPYSAKHPIPTISKYREERTARQDAAEDRKNSSPKAGDYSEPNGDYQLHQKSREDAAANLEPVKTCEDDGEDEKDNDNQEDGGMQDTSQVDAYASDPKQRRKELKKSKRERAEREVTDPVTHFPVTIHDFTDDALESVSVNEPPFGTTQKTATGAENKSKSDEQLGHEQREVQQSYDAMGELFPPPDFDALRLELAAINKRGVTFGLTGVAIIVSSAFAFERLVREGLLQGAKAGSFLFGGTLWLALVAASAGATWLLVVSVREWISNKVNNIFHDEVWDAHRRGVVKASKQNDTETTVWLNSLIGSVWPLINPDLFASLADTLEDVMQASLPKFVRMVSVDDIGQGSESVRILGVRWLPTGAAARAVGEDGQLMTREQSENDTQEKDDENSDSGSHIQDGMEAEEGDFVNLEVAFAYRTRSSSKSLKERTKDMHLCLAFYLPGNIKVPVWVDLQGIIGTMRMRLQLTPDPPFFALCTLTLLGQPKVNVSCVPLSKHAINIMDVPFISNFVQSSVDAAMAEYVAPKSLTLDLKDMLAGDDFKKDTNAVGVLVVNIKRGYDFKMGDSGIPLIKDGSSDGYVSVGWAKFGKVMWSTRVLENEMEPYWDETCFILVSPQELNIDERLRVQLWDSDRLTADDDLGRIEIPVKDLMKDDRSNGKMWHREDGFRALKSGDDMPGKLEWSVGYYSKTRIQQCQFEKQTHNPEIRNMDQLKEIVRESSERKLRETMFKEGKKERDASELEQQTTQELKAEQDAMIISAPPPEGYPSGILSIQIHNITGLELERLNKRKAANDAEATDEEETGEGLPSAYCTVILNHRKIFKTRTKPQNAKPFYNAGCERFIRDWQDSEVFITVRDARLKEDDPLLGIIHLPLAEVFREHSQVMGFWPLTGGVGFGRVRISMVFRSIQLQAPRNLLGWQYGTVEVNPTATVVDCPNDLRSSKLKFRTSISGAKMYTEDNEENQGTVTWKSKRGKSLALAVASRYSSCMSIAFREKGFFGDDTAAFAVLWLKDIVDEEETELELPIWKGDFQRATSCCLEDCGERLGTIRLKLTYWSGLGSAHSRWASRDPHLKNVVEVIEMAHDNFEVGSQEKKAGIVGSDDDEQSGRRYRSGSIGSNSDSSSSSSDTENEDEQESSVPNGSSSQKQGPIDQLRDYRRRDRRLHRQHRGLMQWKSTGTELTEESRPRAQQSGSRKKAKHHYDAFLSQNIASEE
ncbi:hypothetical protein FGSG_00738 [Fusarium graminearum PH-1]|uniref:Chromosome 1, complete genome n=1 Tax=Gibberella zeae (strain ATCC MYA-4620 / CBS 123657 / FGSC 9075 / NRRL 31084 / PH-1) TaxID=229533 RepID=I1RB33_GIBZE|nr:hypothetical protein FGSG_00738 [Fusarium graminearum PH-1]ESU05962.1 hypothetical protein FGSG_00738 [Fusarium graminearum PH-1]CEF72735.1 unnamed protein product [Fusarium graminearum]|eukprot:XP_011316447.1 hypothetical protein FGSG_00738 [Fusarium graminearum PH-1]